MSCGPNGIFQVGYDGAPPLSEAKVSALTSLYLNERLALQAGWYRGCMHPSLRGDGCFLFFKEVVAMEDGYAYQIQCIQKTRKKINAPCGA